MSSCWYPVIKPCAIKTYFNIKWIPAGRQEKGEWCFLRFVMFRHRYSEMLLPLWIQKCTICKSQTPSCSVSAATNPVPATSPYPSKPYSIQDKGCWKTKPHQQTPFKNPLKPRGAVWRSPFLHDISAPPESPTEPGQLGCNTTKYLEQGNVVHLRLHYELSLKASCFLIICFEI